ncbi:MAG: PqqD family protein [Fimbriimonas sp.]|nr:PqqD family protein [Fimbriimonas sp.]
MGNLVDLVRKTVDRTERLDPEKLRKAKPLRNPDVTFESIEDGSLLLSAPLSSQGRGMVGMIAKWMKAPDRKKFELEPFGAFVWNLCDGKHTFEGISKGLRETYKLNRLEADASLLAFLQMLSQRRLITMMVEKDK